MIIDKELEDLSLSAQQKLMQSGLNKKMNEILTNDSQLRPLFSKRNLPILEDIEGDRPPVNPDEGLADRDNINLVVSGMFMGNAGPDEPELESEPLNSDEFMDLNKFEELVLELDPAKLDPRKILHYLEFLDAQNLMFRWDQGDRIKYEGFVLMLIYNDSQFLNSFVFKPYLQRFISRFIAAFEEEYVEEVANTENLLMDAPNLALLVSFNKDMCNYLETIGIHDMFNTHLDDFENDRLKLYIRILINLVERCPNVLEHLLGYQFFPLLIEKIPFEGRVDNLVLFLQLVLSIRYAGYQIREFFDDELIMEILNNLENLISDNENFKIISSKLRLKIMPFDNRKCGNALDTMDKYLNENRETISAKLTDEEYTRFYFYGEVFMEFMKLNLQSIPKRERKKFLDTAFTIYAVYYYQPSIAENFLGCLTKGLSQRHLNWVFDNFYSKETFANLTGNFEKMDEPILTPSHVTLMIELQKVYMKTLDILEKSNQGLSRIQAKIMLDGVFLVKKACDRFNNRIKEIYLGKGLVKFIKKIKTDLDVLLVKPYRTIQTNNNLILRSISKCFDFNESIEYQLSSSKNLKLIENGEKLEPYRLIKTVNLWERPLYFAAKADRANEIVSTVDKFLESTISEISRFTDFVLQNNIESRFEEAQTILDYLLLGLFYLKAKAPDGSSKRKTSNRVIQSLARVFARLLSNVKAFVDVNYNNQIYLLLEQFNLFFFLYADFDLGLLERLPLYFVTSLKSRYTQVMPGEIPSQKKIGKVPLDDGLVNSFLNFLNEFVDLKTKSVYLNFLIMKQVDTMFIYLDSKDALNNKLMKKIFSKAISVQFTEDLHKISPQYLFAYSVEFLDQTDVFHPFLSFILRNNLFLNPFVRSLLRDLLPKNFPRKTLEFNSQNQRLLFYKLIFEESPDELFNKMILHVVDQSSACANLKSLFLDHLLVFHELAMEKPEEEFVQKLVRQILQNATLMDRLISLYQSDKMNLEQVLVVLLKTAQKFGMLGDIDLPSSVTSGILSNSVQTGNSALTRHVLNFLAQNETAREKHKEELMEFLITCKRFMDGQILFCKSEGAVRSSSTVHSVMALANFCVGPLELGTGDSFEMAEGFDSCGLDPTSANEYLLKFVFAHFEKFSELELVHLNNLHNYFGHFRPKTSDPGQVKVYMRELKAHKEMMLLCLRILRERPSLDNNEDRDSQTRLMSHCYYIFNKSTREEMIEFVMALLRKSFNMDEEGKLIEEMSEEGSQEKEEGEEDTGSFLKSVIAKRNLDAFRENLTQDLSQELFNDFYFLLDYEYNLSRPLHEIIREEKENEEEEKEEEEQDAKSFASEEKPEDVFNEGDKNRETQLRNMNDFFTKTISSPSDLTDALDPKKLLSKSVLDGMDINQVIRYSLRFAHSLKHIPVKWAKQEGNVNKILDFYKQLLDKHFDTVHSIPKLEKLVSEILVQLRRVKPTKLNSLAIIFLRILNDQPSFKLSSLVDKFIYMGLFISYFDAKKKATRIALNEDTLDFESRKFPRTFKNIPDFDVILIRDSILLLDMDLPPENEIIVLKFIKKLIRLAPSKFFNSYVTPPEKILKKIFIGTGALLKKKSKEWTEAEFHLLKRRLRMSTLALHWLKPEGFEKAAESKNEEKKNKKKKKSEDQKSVNPMDNEHPFFTINYLTQGYGQSIQAKYNTLTAHYEPLTEKSHLNNRTRYGTYHGNYETNLENDPGNIQRNIYNLYNVDDEITDKVYDSAEWLAVQIKEHVMLITPISENLKSRTDLRVTRKVCEYLYALAKLLRITHRTQIKGIMMDCFYRLIEPTLPCEDPKMLALQNILLMYVMKLSRNKYDELRIVRHKDFAKKIVGFLGDEESLRDITFARVEYTEEEIVAEPMMSLKRDEEAMVEKALAFFMFLCKNKMYLTKDYKEQIFEILDRYKSTIIVSKFARRVFLKLAEEFKLAEMSFYLDKKAEIKESLPEGLNRRQKNVLYVQKVLSKLWESLEKQDELNDKQIRFLNFTLIALQHHLLYGLDPEIFTKLKLARLCIGFATNEKLEANFRLAFVEVIYVYMKRTKEANMMKEDDVKEFVLSYKKLNAEEEPDYAIKYYKTLDLILNHIELSHEFIVEFFEDVKDYIFYDDEEAAPLHVENLFLFVKLLSYKPETDLEELQDSLFEFCKANHKRLTIREKGYLLEVMMSLEERGIFFRNPKLKSILTFLMLRLEKQTRRNIQWCLRSLNACAKMSPNFKEYMYQLGFELFFKHCLRKHGDHKELLRPLCQSYLHYSYNLDENKFEMIDCLKYFKTRVVNYHRKNDMLSTTYILKSVINSSLLKSNAEWLINNKFNEQLVQVINPDEFESSSLAIATLFNLIYVFDKGEIKVADFVTRPVLNMIARILENAIMNENEDLVNEIIDLLLAFIQHEYYLFFDAVLIKQFKFALNFYYENTPMLSKFLSILKDLSFSTNNSVKVLIREHFDFLYLYHVHFRNLQHKKINLMVKQIILNILRADPQRWTESSLLIFGIPENVVHTFSFMDNFSIISINLKIILFSLRFEKCVFFVKNHFLGTIAQILTQFSLQKRKNIPEENEEEDDEEGSKKGKNLIQDVKESQVVENKNSEYRMYPNEITTTAMEILLTIHNHFGDLELISASYFFNDLENLELLLEFYETNPRYLRVIMKLLKNVIENQPELVDKCSPSLCDRVKDILQSKYVPSDKTFLGDVYYVLSRLEFSKANNQRYELKNNKIGVSYNDKVFMDQGGRCMIIIDGFLLKHCKIRFDFVTEKLELHNSKPSKKNIKNQDHPATKKLVGDGVLSVKMKHLSKPRDLESKEILKVQDFFKSYFNKRLRKELYLPLGMFIEDQETLIFKNVYMIFENEFKSKKWNGLVSELFKINQSNTIK